MKRVFETAPVNGKEFHILGAEIQKAR